MTISIIAAMSSNGVIGYHGRVPWNLPEDLNRFRALTLGKGVIMGRKTYESIGRPLDGRTNVVMTRGAQIADPRVCTARNMDEAVHMAKDGCPNLRFNYTSTEVMVIGGEEVYRRFLPVASRIYLTVLEKPYDGDARIIIPAEFYPSPGSIEQHEGYIFVVLDRTSSKSSDK